MGRLIDADELSKVITQDWFLDILLTQNGKSDIAKKLVDMIDSVPLAYDVEKVVEALEEQQEYYSFDFDNDLDCAKYKAYKNAIDIVKRGGVDNEYKR